MILTGAKQFGAGTFGNGSARSVTRPAAVYPGAVAGDLDLGVASNRLQVALAATLSNIAVSMTVTDASQIVAGTLLSIDNEIVQATAAPAGTSVAIRRGFDGTTPALHLSGAVVAGLIDAWHHNALVAEVEAIENALGPNLSHISPTSNLPVAIATNYDFQPLQPGGSLVIGANVITLNPKPAAIAIGGKLYISGGTGTAEAATVTGWNPGTGQAIVTCANTHSGAWTIKSASAGIQEAVASLGSAGGEVYIPMNCTLLADVVNLGVANILIKKFEGVTISGAFKLFGYSPAPTGRSEFETEQPVFDNTVHSASKIGSMNGANPVTIYQSMQEQANLYAVDGVDGVVTIPQSSTQWEGCGVFGGVLNASTTTNGVAGRFYGQATASGTAGNPVKTWGINTLLKDGSTGTHFQYGQIINEWDFNVNDPTTSVIAHSIGGASSAQPASSLGYVVNTLGGAGTSIKWDDAFISVDGAAATGLSLGTLNKGNNTPSQPISMWSRSTAGTAFLAQIQNDTLGNLTLTASTDISFTADGVPIVCKVNGFGIALSAGKVVAFGKASTGAGSAALGANCPAGTMGAPYTWIECKAPDGQTVFIPAWK